MHRAPPRRRGVRTDRSVRHLARIPGLVNQFGRAACAVALKTLTGDSRSLSGAKDVVNALCVNAPGAQICQVVAEARNERQSGERSRGQTGEAAHGGWAVTAEQRALLTAHAAALGILELMCEP
jgi:hypothetical protein